MRARFEQFQSFTDDALTVCPECEGRLRKVFNAVGVVFKGSGFYRNDSRTRRARPARAASSNGGETSADSTGSTSNESSGSTSGEKSSTSAHKRPRPAAGRRTPGLDQLLGGSKAIHAAPPERACGRPAAREARNFLAFGHDPFPRHRRPARSGGSAGCARCWPAAARSPPRAPPCAVAALAAGHHAPPPPRTTGARPPPTTSPAGVVLAAADLRRAPLRPAGVPDGTLPATRRASVGRTLAGPVRAGEPVTDARLVEAGLLRGYPGPGRGAGAHRRRGRGAAAAGR